MALFLPVLSLSAYGQEVQLIKIDQLEELISEDDNSLTVVNFWSTWCVPCVKELPFFDELNTLYPDAQIKVIFVSLDFTENLESKVVPLLKKKEISRRSYLLDETDPNKWMENIDPSWKGSIPATLVVKKSISKRNFYEQSFTRESLREVLFN